jgi:hypothetical protein
MPSARHPDKRKISAWVTDAERVEILAELGRLGFASLSDFLHSLAKDGINVIAESIVDNDESIPSDLDVT